MLRPRRVGGAHRSRNPERLRTGLHMVWFLGLLTLNSWLVMFRFKRRAAAPAPTNRFRTGGDDELSDASTR
jgi:hypothetical protein